jgi:HAD superfamily hydrolase (TIGR01509 family)
VKQRAVVFDLDGTLVVFRFDGAGARKEIVRELASMGFDTRGLEEQGPTQRLVESARTQVESQSVKADFEEVRGRVYAVLDRFEAADMPGRVAFPETKRTLGVLRAEGVRLGVLTNSGRVATVDALERAGIQDYFEFVLTRDEVKSMKPEPLGVLMAVKAFGLPASQVVYVGDSMYDIAAAKMAGLEVISVATGNYTAERLKEEGADHVIPSISDLPEALGLHAAQNP